MLNVFCQLAEMISRHSEAGLDEVEDAGTEACIR